MRKESRQNVLILTGFFLINLIASNPNLADHKEAVFDKYQVGAYFIDQYVRKKDLLFFSITSIEFKEHHTSEFIGIGIVGNVFLFTDEKKDALITSRIVSNSPTVIRIGNQEWMTSNLNVDRFRNGDLIPEVRDDSAWAKAGENKQPAWCYIMNDSSIAYKYGKLYNWYAVMDPRGLAPIGFRVPTNEDWKNLITNIGGDINSGFKLKAGFGWEVNGNGINSVGFSAFPGNMRPIDYPSEKPGYTGVWWGYTNYPDSTNSWFTSYRGNTLRGGYSEAYDKSFGYYVRCIKE